MKTPALFFAITITLASFVSVHATSRAEPPRDSSDGYAHQRGVVFSGHTPQTTINLPHAKPMPTEVGPSSDQLQGTILRTVRGNSPFFLDGINLLIPSLIEQNKFGLLTLLIQEMRKRIQRNQPIGNLVTLSLHQAILQEYTTEALVWIALGANVNEKFEPGVLDEFDLETCSYLELAIRRNNPEAVALLLAAGAIPDRALLCMIVAFQHVDFKTGDAVLDKCLDVLLTWALHDYSMKNSIEMAVADKELHALAIQETFMISPQELLDLACEARNNQAMAMLLDITSD
jgi:hypothetical protein